MADHHDISEDISEDLTEDLTEDISVPELAEYISDLASELAQMAKAANFTPLARHLEMATLEAERLTEDGQLVSGPPAPH